MLKKLTGLLCPLFILLSCRYTPQILVSQPWVDSVLADYSSPAQRIVTGDLEFWKKRMDSLPDLYVNAPEYAAALAAAFRMNGNIHDLRKADTLYQQVNNAHSEKEPAILRTLAGLALLQHQFNRADTFLRKAIAIEGNTLPNAFLDFDISFEQGNYNRAKTFLASLKKGNQYGYLFRKAKYEHYAGSLDTAIACMERAAEKAKDNRHLQQAALSNAADLYLHKGDAAKAARRYIQSIQTDASDLHSLAGLGWIALVHDHNDSLAERIFRFVREHTQSPDILLKLVALEETRNNKALQKKYAEEFATLTTDPVYGKMYSKYLVGLYTGILQNPGKAVTLAAAEINNRPTPQVYAWYAWALFCNQEKEKAWDLYKGFVSGRPLEGTELYYMGKLMQGLDKKYNAQQFFKAAWKNRYDLSPAQQEDLENNLD